MAGGKKTPPVVQFQEYSWKNDKVVKIYIFLIFLLFAVQMGKDLMFALIENGCISKPNSFQLWIFPWITNIMNLQRIPQNFFLSKGRTVFKAAIFFITDIF